MKKKYKKNIINQRLYNFYHSLLLRDNGKVDVNFYLTKAEIYNHSTLQRCVVEFKFVSNGKIRTIKIDRSRNFSSEANRRFYTYLLFYYCIWKCYEKLVSILNSNKLDPFMGNYEIKYFIEDEFKKTPDDDETGIMYEESYICSEYMKNKINGFIDKY